ncbi:MAG: TIGR00725 family protein [Candidatus Thermoplasmatota archaeon]|jgi:uncharacterized protein (TIGR00725 family)|nr:TIGR00725 family protein [Candidatus Thermoplasmatota archaeon]
MVYISVIGGSLVTQEYCEIAYKVGKLLAQNHAIVVCGGLTGVMECVAKGVHENGGISIGILPGMDRKNANQYLTASIPTGIGFARDFLVVRGGEAVIAIDGSTGTHTEAYFAISEGKTVVAIGSMDIKTRKDNEGVFLKASSAEEAVKLALDAAAKR